MTTRCDGSGLHMCYEETHSQSPEQHCTGPLAERGGEEDQGQHGGGQ